MPNRYRHSYLHRTEAVDSNHVLAAALELRAHKGDSGRYQAGHLFVDNNDALEATQTLLDQHINETREKAGRHKDTLHELRRTQADPRRIRSAENRLRQTYEQEMSLMHARAHTVSVEGGQRNLSLFGNDSQNPDKLYVKGHGNPRSPDWISTKVTERQGDHERGFKAQHSIGDVASGVKRIRDKWPETALEDIRLTSCGSGGGFDFDGNGVQEQGNGAARTLSDELHRIDSGRTYQVSGYRASTNSSFPRTGVAPGKHFTSKIKFPEMPNWRGTRTMLAQRFGNGAQITSGVDKKSYETQTRPLNPHGASFTDYGAALVGVARNLLPPVQGGGNYFDRRRTQNTGRGMTVQVRRSQTRRRV